MTKTQTTCVLLIAAAALCVPVLSAHAQSLGEVAKREAARRQAVKQPVKVFTNESLRGGAPAAPPAAAGDQAGAPAAPPAAAAPAQAEPPKEEPAPDVTKDPEYWRKRMADARQARDRNAFLMESVQSRINALTTDFYARDDPYQRAQIGVERQKTLDMLELMEKEQAEIEEEARRANVPPGWLR